MAVAAELMPPQVLTYEEYMIEGEIYARYDIIDGERVYMTQPTDGHQEIVLNIVELLRRYQRTAKAGRTISAPADVLVWIAPLRTRQPDVLFISRERYGTRLPQAAEPLSPAPELVVEVLSPSETRSIRAGKIRDYCAVDVRECWVVDPEAETVEVLRLSPEGQTRAALYGSGQSIHSLTSPDLTMALDDIFRLEE